ncbi:hypothetical protein JS532_02945 [Bifidobacterium callimiconis]|uniref:hypothetical protein n=1 Tax=Bifidobacterium callimiconis TaxID=2306973 RepID=UPI001BDBCEE2|nr:hypothetical protein [Bifidobacterium callimiconis]MBT1176522.1 hypothetical protein [Bifidobacterium callimiconis]
MTETPKRNDDTGAETTTSVLDEFLREHRTRTVKGTVRILKEKRSFGESGFTHIKSCVAKVYYANQESLRNEFGFDDLDACVNTFYADKIDSLVKAIDDGKIKDDTSFDKIVTTAARNWVSSLFERTDTGKKRDILRQRMKRDPRKRFKNYPSNSGKRSLQYVDVSRWGLVHGSDQPTTQPDIVLELATMRYPIDIDYEKFADPNRQRNPSYGKKGQLENMLEGILQAAEGTLTLTGLLRIVQFRVTPLQTPRVISMDRNPERPMDLPDPDSTETIDLVSRRERLMEAAIQHFESLDKKDLEQERNSSEWASRLEALLGETLIHTHGKALS